MKKVTSEIINGTFDLEPFALEISIDYDGGFNLKAVHEIMSGDLCFSMSQNESEMAFYPSEIEVIQEMINDAREIAQLNMKYDERVWGDYYEWEDGIREAIKDLIADSNATDE